MENNSSPDPLPPDESEHPTRQISNDAAPQVQPPAQPIETPPPSGQTLKRKAHWRRYYAWIILVLVIAAASSYVYVNYHKSKPVIYSSTQNKAPSTSGYQFFTAAKELNNLDFFNNSQASNQFMANNFFGDNCGSTTPTCPGTPTYFQIGVTPANQPIIEVSQSGGYQGILTAIEIKPGAYEIIWMLNQWQALNATLSQLRSVLNPNVTVNTTLTIPPLEIPSTITIDNTTFKTSNIDSDVADWAQSLSSLESSNSEWKFTLLSKTNQISYYEVADDSSSGSGYSTIEIERVIGGILGQAYSLDDSLNAASSSAAPVAITWNNGSVNTNLYLDTQSNCNARRQYNVANNVTASELTKVGTTPQGQVIYQLPLNSPLLKAYYQSYQADNGFIPIASNLQNMTLQQYQNSFAVILKQDGLGQYVVYDRWDLAPVGGCGKPVIYLYPSVPTDVSIRIGALIVKSDPHYPKNGWENIEAYPNGRMVYQGKDYNSLYWEGFGNGSFPLIDSGVVVKKSDAAATIRKQLLEQGLNQNEVNQFMTFWQPKLPNSPYIRLTWLDTAQMNELAPLNVYPKPKTEIRIFLDFSGLNQPLALKPQNFSNPGRQGFTLVEWGGLLNNLQL